MAQNVNPTFVKTPNANAAQISTGVTASSAVTVYTGGANGSKIPGFIAAAIGTTGAFDVQWGVSNGTTLFTYGTVSIPAGAGSSDSIPTVNMFNTTNMPQLTNDSDGNAYVILPSSSWTLQAKSPATSSAWATGAVINLIVPAAGDF